MDLVTLAEVKRKYRRKALEAHPDRHNGNQEKWLQLSLYYGALRALAEKNEENKGNKLKSSKLWSKISETVQSYMKQHGSQVTKAVTNQ